MKYLSIILIVLLISSPGKSAFLQLSPSARLAAVSNISGLDTSPSSIFINPAINNESFAICSTYYRLFSLDEISYKNLSVCRKFGLFNFAIGFQEIGNNLYKEQTFILASNYQIINRITIGLDCRYNFKIISDFANADNIQFDLGLKIKAGKFEIFSTVTNCNFASMDGEVLPQECRSGFIYNAYKNFKIGMCLVKELDYPFNLNLGIEYRLLENLILMSGIQTEPARFSLGIEIKIYKFSICYATKTHQYLKNTNYISISYNR